MRSAVSVTQMAMLSLLNSESASRKRDSTDQPTGKPGPVGAVLAAEVLAMVGITVTC